MPKLQRSIEVLGIQHINVPSLKPEAVDKRILVDILMDIYEWKSHHRHAITLISGDKDFGHLLSRIHKLPEVAKLYLLRLPRNNNEYTPMNPYLCKMWMK